MKLVLACLLTLLPGCVWYLNPQCDDKVRDGDETDLDCGGSCGKCIVGQSCNNSAECEDSNCVGGRCTPFDCVNGVKGQQETDVDCGGGMCRRCSGGHTCLADSDCFSGKCEPATRTCSELATVSFANAVSYPSGLKSYALLSGDMNGDGRVDLAVLNEEDSSISVFLASDGGSLQTVVSGETAYRTGEYPTGGRMIDLNGDGILDVVTADYHGNSISVLVGLEEGMSGKGSGKLAPHVAYPTIPGGETSNLDVADVNGDGKLDVVACDPQKHAVSIFLGKGDGTFAAADNQPVGTGTANAAQPYSVALGDFDGNGTSDMAIGDLVVGPLIVKLGRGDGTFQADVPYPTGAVGPFIILTYDLNLDGKLDLVVADRGSDDVTVLLGRGDGSFRAPIHAGTGKGTGPYSIAVADFNRDGVPDVVTANFLSSTGSVLLGVGDGTFETVIDAGPSGRGSYGVAVGDFNGDGKPDFGTANSISWDLTIKLSTAH